MFHPFTLNIMNLIKYSQVPIIVVNACIYEIITMTNWLRAGVLTSMWDHYSECCDVENLTLVNYTCMMCEVARRIRRSISIMPTFLFMLQCCYKTRFNVCVIKINTSVRVADLLNYCLIASLSKNTIVHLTIGKLQLTIDYAVFSHLLWYVLLRVEKTITTAY